MKERGGVWKKIEGGGVFRDISILKIHIEAKIISICIWGGGVQCIIIKRGTGGVQRKRKKADRACLRDYSTHRQTPLTDDSYLLFAALGSVDWWTDRPMDCTKYILPASQSIMKLMGGKMTPLWLSKVAPFSRWLQSGAIGAVLAPLFSQWMLYYFGFSLQTT